MESLATILERVTYVCSLGYWLCVLGYGGGDSRDVAGLTGREASNGASPGSRGLPPDLHPDHAGRDQWDALKKKEAGRRLLAEADEVERLEQEWKQSYMRSRKPIDMPADD